VVASSFSEVLLRDVLPWVGAAVLLAALVWFFASGIGYKKFVAWRYLLVDRPKVTRRAKLALLASCGAYVLALLVVFGLHVGPQTPQNPLLSLCAIAIVITDVVGFLRHSIIALAAFLLGFLASLVGGALELMAVHHVLFHSPEGVPHAIGLVILVCLVGGGILSFLAMFFGTLRAFFTFFATVPIGGVWIGTGALVCVLAVMSGFESDLRTKILGSNAHIQVTREDGDFTEWRSVDKRIDQIPGVVASTPYAVSEVVIAANNNGMNVIIKGIDPKTVGKVTELVHDLEDHDAMKRLEPLIPDRRDLSIPQHPQAPGGEDPPPPDMPTGGNPIDFSAPAPGAEPPPDGDDGLEAGSGSGSASDSGSATGSGAALGSAVAMGVAAGSGSPIGHGDGFEDLDDPAPVEDPPPPDLLTTADPPIDYTQAGSGVDPTVHVVDVPDDEPAMSERTRSLPGILVGRELVKQTHLYTGEEVRVVSPLSDPSNPDATGTPIPFNRDYRVAGVFYTGMYEYDLKYVYVTLDSLDEFLDRGDSVDGIEVRVTSPDDTDFYVKKIGDVLGPQYRVQDWKELNRSLFSALKLEKIAMFFVLGIVILVASFAIVGNLIMVVVEKGREIALLKTLGASDRGVMQLFAIQGLLIGLVGTALGIGFGLLACTAGKHFGIPLNPDVYYIDRMPVHVEWMSVVLTAAAGVLISIAATLYPALLAARVRPATGLRH
jgi:lipoprotein-releasing system permease protein